MKHILRTRIPAMAVLMSSVLTAAGEESASLSVRFQGFLQEHFPGLYEKSLEGYGWCSVDGKNDVPLPSSLPRQVVALVHGLDEPGKLWMNLGPELTGKGYAVCEFRYPNDQPIRWSAVFFLDALTQLRERGTAQVIIVAHSMGGLVSREALANPDYGYTQHMELGVLPRIEGLIMVGTPNQGSKLAHLRWFAEWRDHWTRFVHGKGHLLGPFADGCGQAGEDLIPGSPFLKDLNSRSLPETVRTTIIAGVVSPLTEDEIREEMTRWQERAPKAIQEKVTELQEDLLELTDGIGDGVVPLASTRLDGVSDHVTVPGTHLSMIRNVSTVSSRMPPAIPIIMERIEKIWPEKQ